MHGLTSRLFTTRSLPRSPLPAPALPFPPLPFPFRSELPKAARAGALASSAADLRAQALVSYASALKEHVAVEGGWGWGSWHPAGGHGTRSAANQACHITWSPKGYLCPSPALALLLLGGHCCPLMRALCGHRPLRELCCTRCRQRVGRVGGGGRLCGRRGRRHRQGARRPGFGAAGGRGEARAVAGGRGRDGAAGGVPAERVAAHARGHGQRAAGGREGAEGGKRCAALWCVVCSRHGRYARLADRRLVVWCGQSPSGRHPTSCEISQGPFYSI